MNSFLDSETLRGREREEEGGEGEGEGDQKQAPPFKVPGPREGQGFQIRPLFSAGAKGAESGGNLRSYRRPFHSDCDLPRIHNPGEEGAETTTRRFYLPECTCAAENPS
jgi:hypothetical protein